MLERAWNVGAVRLLCSVCAVSRHEVHTIDQRSLVLRIGGTVLALCDKRRGRLSGPRLRVSERRKGCARPQLPIRSGRRAGPIYEQSGPLRYGMPWSRSTVDSGSSLVSSAVRSRRGPAPCWHKQGPFVVLESWRIAFRIRRGLSQRREEPRSAEPSRTDASVFWRGVMPRPACSREDPRPEALRRHRERCL
jgi:hypothetical protein